MRTGVRRWRSKSARLKSGTRGPFHRFLPRLRIGLRVEAWGCGMPASSRQPGSPAMSLAGYIFLGKYAEQAVGTIKFQLSDPEFWPDVPQTEAAFIHRLAVRREFAGGCVSSALLRWAVQRTGSVGRRFLRLDCEASRPKLRGIYERFGFRHHSDREVGPFFVARYELEVGHINRLTAEQPAV